MKLKRRSQEERSRHRETLLPKTPSWRLNHAPLSIPGLCDLFNSWAHTELGMPSFHLLLAELGGCIQDISLSLLLYKSWQAT